MSSEVSDTEPTGRRRTLIGRVVSDKMNKTVTVEVVRTVRHRRYHKFVNRRKKYHAHDENNECKVDDLVVIQESRPLSKTKRWVVLERRQG
ncbi:MAG: 30S ribosomal protein S17 [Alphaproteobacteria bacterium]|nr:30S ribosomal protein S17 [Alphaproteobacteria bacterium]MCB9696128.1 30S ribosomal protein S17 [Alphaproteobacteria bacterium]